LVALDAGVGNAEVESVRAGKSRLCDAASDMMGVSDAASDRMAVRSDGVSSLSLSRGPSRKTVARRCGQVRWDRLHRSWRYVAATGGPAAVTWVSSRYYISPLLRQSSVFDPARDRMVVFDAVSVEPKVSDAALGNMKVLDAAIENFHL
jgi:hypothetical protein